LSDQSNSEAANRSHFRLGYRPALDGLRGIFLLAVMVYHADANDGEMGLFPGAFLGVDGFFVLSGFLITVLLCQEWDRANTISLRNFYARRALRLLPALCFWLACVVVFVTIFLKGPIVTAIWNNIIPVLFYHMNWAIAYGDIPPFVHHAWSLSVEEQFYILWPLTLSILLRLRIKWSRIIGLVAGGIVASALWRLMLLASAAPVMRMYVGLDTRADALLVGCLVGLIASRDLLPVSPRVWKWINLAGYASIVFLVALIFKTSIPSRYLYYGGFTLVAIGVGMIIVMVLGSPPKRLLQILELPWLVWVGRVSYGLYLWHRTIYQGFGPSRAFLPEWIGLAIATLIIFAAATFSFYLIEQPFLRLKDRFSSSARGITGADDQTA